MPINFVIQRVEKASLLIDNKEEYKSIEAGIIIYISIYKETKEEDLERIVENITKCQFYHDVKNNFKPSNIIDVVCDIMIIPQASLAGKVFFIFYKDERKKHTISQFDRKISRRRIILGVYFFDEEIFG
jgi:hypothetical protein